MIAIRREWRNFDVPFLCVFITAGPSTKLFACVWGGYWRTCATRDDEPRPVWTSLPISGAELFAQMECSDGYQMEVTGKDGNGARRSCSDVSPMCPAGFAQRLGGSLNG